MRKLNTDELNRVSVEKFDQLDKLPVICVLDNIRSQHNIGSIFRTSDAFRISGLYLCGITATPPNREINKSALGATESVKWQYFEDTLSAVNQLKKEGYKIIAIEQAAESVFLEDYVHTISEKVALVFGNEVMGVSEQIMEEIDACIEIPQFGTKHSFNVSVTAAIVLYQFYLRLKSF
ncbi:MAG: RNA methyltransferase [Bacteroidales bacterium]